VLFYGSRFTTNATVVDDAIKFVAERSYKGSKETVVNSDDEHVYIKRQEVSKMNINTITNNRFF
jgi:hypothetical protein